MTDQNPYTSSAEDMGDNIQRSFGDHFQRLAQSRSTIIAASGIALLFAILATVNLGYSVLLYMHSDESITIDLTIDLQYAKLLRASICKQAVMAIGLAVVSWRLWALGATIQRIASDQPQDLSELFDSQKACWKTVSILAVTYALLSAFVAIAPEL